MTDSGNYLCELIADGNQPCNKEDSALRRN